jgi:hypothetical protein
MLEQTYLRRAGSIGIFPLVLIITLCALGRFPYPDNNIGGQEYLTYVLPHHVGEIQTIMWIVIAGLLLLVVLHLALAYMERAGRLTSTGIIMIVVMTVYVAVQLVAVGVYVTAVQLARGYPGFEAAPEDLKLITLIWDTSNMIFSMGALPLAIVWGAIVRANRDPRTSPCTRRLVRSHRSRNQPRFPRHPVHLHRPVGTSLLPLLFLGTRWCHLRVDHGH